MRVTNVGPEMLLGLRQGVDVAEADALAEVERAGVWKAVWAEFS